MTKTIKHGLIVVAIMATVTVAAPQADACSCMPPSVHTTYKGSTDVIVARVIWGTLLGNKRWYVVRSSKTFKGCTKDGEWLLVSTASSGAACGTQLAVGSTYLLTGYAGNQNWGVTVLGIGICGYNKKVSDLTASDREWLMARNVCCNNKCECADGSKPVSCFADPCKVNSCPGGNCTANYCGGCNAEFYDNSGKPMCTGCESDKDCGQGQTCDKENGLCLTSCQGKNENCNEGFWCSPTQDNGWMCKAYKQEGESCGGFTPAWNQSKCDPDLKCTDFTPMLPDAPGKCRKPCKADKDCGDGYCGTNDVCRNQGECFDFADCNEAGNWTFKKLKCMSYGSCQKDKTCKQICGNIDCMDVAKEDLGWCQDELGYAVTNNKCAQIKGCKQMANGYVFHKTLNKCKTTCGEKTDTKLPPEKKEK